MRAVHLVSPGLYLLVISGITHRGDCRCQHSTGRHRRSRLEQADQAIQKRHGGMQTARVLKLSYSYLTVIIIEGAFHHMIPIQ